MQGRSSSSSRRGASSRGSIGAGLVVLAAIASMASAAGASGRAVSADAQARPRVAPILR